MPVKKSTAKKKVNKKFSDDPVVEAERQQLDPTGQLQRLFDDLGRYKQFGTDVDVTMMAFGLFPLDFSLRVLASPLGNCHVDFKSLGSFLLDAYFSERIGLSDKELDEWVKANKERMFVVFDVISYMVRHAPKKIDNALFELFCEAHHHHALKNEARRNGKIPPHYKARIAKSRKREEKRILKRLGHNDIEPDVVFAVGRLGLVTKEKVAEHLGLSPRTLQRWANQNFGGGWNEVVERFSSKSGGDKKKP